MAKFKYKMQNILDIKIKLENQAKINFGIAQNAYMNEQQKLQDMLVKRAGIERELKTLMDGPLDLKRIHITRNALDSMKVLVRRQMVEVHKKQKDMDLARIALNEVIKDRKMHEKLKEKALDEFKEELLAEEAKAIDELVSFTHGKR